MEPVVFVSMRMENKAKTCLLNNLGKHYIFLPTFVLILGIANAIL